MKRIILRTGHCARYESLKQVVEFMHRVQPLWKLQERMSTLISITIHEPLVFTEFDLTFHSSFVYFLQFVLRSPSVHKILSCALNLVKVISECSHSLDCILDVHIFEYMQPSLSGNENKLYEWPMWAHSWGLRCPGGILTRYHLSWLWAPPNFQAPSQPTAEGNSFWLLVLVTLFFQSLPRIDHRWGLNWKVRIPAQLASPQWTGVASASRFTPPHSVSCPILPSLVVRDQTKGRGTKL